jgi:2-phosphoglycerate kinase
MLYLVGGASRAGKSTLAERMRTRHGVPWFALDALKMGLFLGAPDLGVHPEHDDLETADLMWPILRPMLENLIFDGRDYLVEGVNLRPQTVAAFQSETEAPIAAVFLGYPEINLDAKRRQVADGAGQYNDWLNRMGEAYISEYLEESRRFSRHLHDECARLGLPFVDTSADLEGALVEAEARLVAPAFSLAGRSRPP